MSSIFTWFCGTTQCNLSNRTRFTDYNIFHLKLVNNCFKNANTTELIYTEITLYRNSSLPSSVRLRTYQVNNLLELHYYCLHGPRNRSETFDLVLKSISSYRINHSHLAYHTSYHTSIYSYNIYIYIYIYAVYVCILSFHTGHMAHWTYL